MVPYSAPETYPLPSLKNYSELIGPKCPLIFPTSVPCIILQRCASKPDCPPVIAAKIAFTPPPITMWNLGFYLSQNNGLIEIVFIGSSCLKYFNTLKVSGSIIFDPLSAAVPKIEKFLLNANELILFLS